MINRLWTYWVDGSGQRWQVCSLCCEWVKFEKLVVDPADGLRWDVCRRCQQYEDEQRGGV